MKNEVRYYLGLIQAALKPPVGDEEPFKPQYLVTAVRLPSGAIELAVNTSNIAEKVDYICEAYDENMLLKSNPLIEMVQLMVV